MDMDDSCVVPGYNDNDTVIVNLSWHRVHSYKELHAMAMPMLEEWIGRPAGS